MDHDSPMSHGEEAWPIADTPRGHGMFMLGTSTIYLCHMPMFTVEDHCYQVILQIGLDEASRAVYLAHRAAEPTAVPNLSNKHNFTLPDLIGGAVGPYTATMYGNYTPDGDPEEQLSADVMVTVEHIVAFRHFNPRIPRPESLTYVLFGDDHETHLSHYIARDPDFQHLLTLPEPPAWLPASQRRTGSLVTFPGLPSEPGPGGNPLVGDHYTVLFEGITSAAQPLTVGTDTTVWYSTGNLLNAHDPFPPTGAAS